MDGAMLTCKQCGKEFSYKNGLLRHQKLTHAKEKKYECNICRRRFGYKNILLEHQNIHFGIKPYACSICDKRFTARSNLVQHRIVHKRPLSCNVCPQRFQSDEALQRHLKGHHETMLSCNLCSFCTPNQIILNEHIHTNHATELNKQKISIQNKFNNSNQRSSRSSTHHEQPFNPDTVPSRLRRRTSTNQQVFDIDTVPIYQHEFSHSSTGEESMQGNSETVDIKNRHNFGTGTIKLEPVSPRGEMFVHSSPFIEPDIRQGTSTIELSDTQSVNEDRVSTPPSYSSYSREAGIPDSTSGIADVLSKLHTCMGNTEESHMRITPRYSISVEPPKSTRDFSSQFTTERADMPSITEVMAYLEANGQIFRCIHCRIMFEDRGLFILHNSLHGQENPWRCTVCNKVCLNKNDFHLHLANQQHG